MRRPCVCSSVGQELKPLAPGCKITAYVPVTGNPHLRRWVMVALPHIDVGKIRTFGSFAHYNCACNQRIALRNRVLGVVPEPSTEGLQRLRKVALRLSRGLGKHMEVPILDFHLQYTGAKRARYERAGRNLLREGLARKKSRISCFVKWEKLRFNPDKPNPDPRAIQHRSPEYGVAVGRFLKPIEHALYRVKGARYNFPPERMIGKGLSQGQRAQLLSRKLRRFRRPIVVTIDASRFDQHCSKSLLEIEHAVYTRANNDKMFAMHMSWQLYNAGYTSMGYRYSTKGKRMSGDMNTGLGNCVLMVIMVAAFFDVLKEEHGSEVEWDLLDDGDDAVILFEEEHKLSVLSRIKEVFLSFGHEIKVDNVATHMEDVEWCQSRPIEYQTGRWKFVRDPAKVMSSALGGIKYLEPTIKARAKLVNTVGLAELILGLGVPILQSYGLALMRNACSDAVLQFDSVDSFYYRLNFELKALNMRAFEKRDPQPITMVARLSFFRAYGVTVQQQLDTESWLDRWTFNLLGDKPQVPNIDVAAWQLDNWYSPEVYRQWE